MNREHEQWRASFYRLLNALTAVEESITDSHDPTKHDLGAEKTAEAVQSYLRGETGAR